MSVLLIDIALFSFLLLTAFAIVRLRNLFAVIMLTSVFSLLSAGLFVTLDAVDVAFTEAAVGAGISTVLMLGTLSLTAHDEKPATRSALLPMLVVFITGGALIYGTMDMPAFGSADAPIHQHVAPEYIERYPHDIDMPNIVTGILSSYRGFDTLGETAVVFTAGIAVILLLHRSTLGRRRREDEEEDDI